MDADARRLHVDYDQIAPTYNRRFIRGKQRVPALILRKLAGETGVHRILEVGCGTGHWLAGLAAGGQYDLYGLDRSAGMLAQAAAREKTGCTIHYIHGQAEALPFPAASFDLVYAVNAVHHFDDLGAFIHSASRVLNLRGVLAIFGMDPRLHGGAENWYVYHYFTGTYETDLQRFPSWGVVLDLMTSAGFGQAEWRQAEFVHDPKVGREVFDDPFLEKNATSQLALLDDRAYQDGLERMRQDIQRADSAGEEIIFHSDIYLDVLIGRL